MNIGVPIFIIASNIISELVVLGRFLMIGLRVVWGSMVSRGGHMVGRGSMDNRRRGIGRSWGVCRGRGIGGRRSVRITAIGGCHKGQRNKGLHKSFKKSKY